MSDVTACPFIHCGSSAVFRSSAMGPPWELVRRAHPLWSVSSLSILMSVTYQIYVSSFLCSAARLCLLLCDPMDCRPSGSPIHGICQARILERVAMSSSRESSWSRIKLVSPALAGRFFTNEPPGSPTRHMTCKYLLSVFHFLHGIL